MPADPDRTQAQKIIRQQQSKPPLSNNIVWRLDNLGAELALFLSDVYHWYSVRLMAPDQAVTSYSRCGRGL